jgi:hypothetical protein
MAGTAASVVTSYDLTVGVIVDMDELIYMLSPMDSPLLSGIDADGKSVLSVQATNERQIDWMTDELMTPRSTTAATIGNTTTANVLTVASGDQARFSTGDVLMIALGVAPIGQVLEYVRVTGYGTTADTLLVTRAWTTTPAVATLTSGSLVIGVGTALPEGSNPERSRVQDRVQYSNVTQIFGPTQVDMSGTEQVVAKYGVPDEFTRQMFMRTQEQVIHREAAFLYGRKVSDSTNKIREMGGIFQFITSVTDSSTTVLSITAVQTIQQSCYNNGGMPDRLSANPASLGDLNSVTDTQRVRQTFDDPRRGRIPVMEVWTEFGPITVVRNRWQNKSDALLWNRNQSVRRVLRPFQMKRLGITGDHDAAMILCEETLEFKGQQHAAKFTGLQYA